ncbi:hypothetical protein BU25DRAFT_173782 [Macroventuria anomochaeta]|uniref:Uncharacterized protein n=1 Tax=Macroventuria anomochaeta TaxID=301207 RepID=A0ACB6RPC9_9PLEO|nr:uncharacterized protein BU25DRAFT_173782 [Macroventuria anomochaeta]KAF2623746.1 hypothetical protein BU25DRAFT_173782 [Macroventuria anomochaeta]
MAEGSPRRKEQTAVHPGISPTLGAVVSACHEGPPPNHVGTVCLSPPIPSKSHHSTFWTISIPRHSQFYDRSATHIVKVVAPVNDKATSRKRNADDARSSYSQKRPKLRPKVDTEIKEAQWVCGYDNFKFLGLPPELRNQIYEYATECTYRCFPMLHKRPKKVCKLAVYHSSRKSTNLPAAERKPVPYLALTQTCMQIRAEFRPMWLSMHRVPLNFMDTYFKAFFPARIPPTLARFKPHVLTSSSLRIWVRKDDLGSTANCCDATRLFKHKARFPDCAITCQSLSSTEDSILRDLEWLINHKNAAWRKSVIGGSISQVRFGLDTDWDTGKKTVAVDMVVKERFAEPWMKIISAAPPKGAMERFLRHFGFELHSRPWKTRVSVDYS